MSKKNVEFKKMNKNASMIDSSAGSASAASGSGIDST